MQTAAITNLMASGGFFMDFTRVMSAGLSVSKADIASFKIGKASARSASHSCFKAWAAAACLLAI